MSDAPPAIDPAAASASPRLEVGIYQVTDDGSFLKNRTDGQGWDFSWAEPRRDWMDRTAQKFAYRCLPLTIVNQTGLWVRNPVGFTALWRSDDPHKVDFAFDGGTDAWKSWITNHFGSGIITWNSPFLFRTKPVGSRILVTGPPNSFKENCQPLTGLVETDWASMTFTMNWKIVEPDRPVRFERGEPIFHVIPLARNPCLDIEQADVVYRRIEDDPAVERSYKEWFQARNKFHELQRVGQVPADGWQKHYFRGVTVDGRDAPTEHYTRIVAPEIRMQAGVKVPDAPAVERPAAPAPVEAHLFAGKAEGARARHEARAEAREAILEGRAPAARPPAEARAPASEPLPHPSRDVAAEARASDANASPAPAPAPAPSNAGAFTPPPGGFRLRTYRLHPRAARLVPAEIDGRRMGFHLYAPLDLDVVWYGGASFEWKALTPFGDEDAAVLAALEAKANGGAQGQGHSPARKLSFEGHGEGVFSLWTGLLLETPPGWGVEVRACAGLEASPLFAAVPEVIESDEAPRALSVRLKLRSTERWARIRTGQAGDAHPAQPIAHLLPVRRESFDAEWLATSFPIEAAKGAVDVYRRWREGESASGTPR